MNTLEAVEMNVSLSPVGLELPVVEVDLDDTLFRDVNRGAANYVAMASGGRYSAVEVFNRGRVTKSEDPLLYDLRQSYFRSPWHLSRLKPEERAAEALKKASTMIKADVLTGRTDDLRPTLMNLLGRYQMLPYVKGEVLLRPPGADYRRHKVISAMARRAMGGVDDDVETVTELSRAGIFAVLIDRPWNQGLRDSHLIKRVGSFAEFVDQMLTYPSFEALAQDHINITELNRLSRTYHTL